MIFTSTANAKLNLYLHVTARREDGYHALDSLCAFADYGDRIEIEPSNHFELFVSGPYARELESDKENNLIKKAADLLCRRLGIANHFKVHLTKNLPLASGIGGGSGNAAETIKGLLQLSTQTIRDKDLKSVLLEIGADMPLAYYGRPCRMQGIGEILTPVKMPTLYGVLCNPGLACPTPLVYKNLLPDDFKPAVTLPDFKAAADLSLWLGAETGNSMTRAAIKNVPEIQTVLEALNAQKDIQLARMSGSGATCFGLFPDLKSAEKAASTLHKHYPDWWVKACRIAKETNATTPSKADL